MILTVARLHEVCSHLQADKREVLDTWSAGRAPREFAPDEDGKIQEVNISPEEHKKRVAGIRLQGLYDQATANLREIMALVANHKA